MTPQERYRQVARLHVRCLDRSFLATLGEGFLAQLVVQGLERGQGSGEAIGAEVFEEHDASVGLLSGRIKPGYTARVKCLKINQMAGRSAVNLKK